MVAIKYRSMWPNEFQCIWDKRLDFWVRKHSSSVGNLLSLLFLCPDNKAHEVFRIDVNAELYFSVALAHYLEVLFVNRSPVKKNICMMQLRCLRYTRDHTIWLNFHRRSCCQTFDASSSWKHQIFSHRNSFDFSIRFFIYFNRVEK